MLCQVYLKKYGYYSEPNDTALSSRLGIPQLSSPLVSPEDRLKNYIMEFQSFAGLPLTGDLDEETVVMMNKPRCGVKDVLGKSASMRKKRYALQVCWFPSCPLLIFDVLTTPRALGGK